MEKDFTKQEEAFAELLNIMETLREKCPWDHKQTMESLRTLSVEEVYELSLIHIFGPGILNLELKI